MIQTALTLEEFLKLPETKPASEFIHGKIRSKPMSQGEHSLIQGKLCEVINAVAQPPKIAYAFPELRCSFGETILIGFHGSLYKTFKDFYQLQVTPYWSKAMPNKSKL